MRSFHPFTLCEHYNTHLSCLQYVNAFQAFHNLPKIQTKPKQIRP
nr:MAG TPA: hypothetical protein [Caudoviricetes sp.]